MKLGRCPICRTHLHLDALINDDAGRALLGQLSKLNKSLAEPLVSYISLFRPENTPRPRETAKLPGAIA